MNLCYKYIYAEFNSKLQHTEVEKNCQHTNKELQKITKLSIKYYIIDQK